MADNRLPDQNLPLSAPAPAGEQLANAERRATLKRGAVALPVLLATVYARTTWAQQQGSGQASGGPSQQGLQQPPH